MNSTKVFELCCRIPLAGSKVQPCEERRAVDDGDLNAGLDRIIAVCFSVLLFVCFEARVGI